MTPDFLEKLHDQTGGKKAVLNTQLNQLKLDLAKLVGLPDTSEFIEAAIDASVQIIKSVRTEQLTPDFLYHLRSLEIWLRRATKAHAHLTGEFTPEPNPNLSHSEIQQPLIARLGGTNLSPDKHTEKRFLAALKNLAIDSQEKTELYHLTVLLDTLLTCLKKRTPHT